ncbi:Fe-S cluster assembly ATPase SufC [soil metagenome]
MLKITNLHARVEDKEILRGVNLTINDGEVHAIMGPNGSGKSTLASVIAGKDGYEVTEGTIELDGEDVLEMDPEGRAAAGIFLAFQYPVEIPGVTNTYFLRAALNNIRKARGEKELSMSEFMKHVRSKAESMDLDQTMLSRAVNEGFSGGEKKRNEIFQLTVLEPKLAVLDETDSGLDVDALKTVAQGVNMMRSEKRSFVIVTHYQRLLNYIVPDFVHILVDGKIAKSGGKELALEVENNGYAEFEAVASAR